MTRFAIFRILLTTALLAGPALPGAEAAELEGRPTVDVSRLRPAGEDSPPGAVFSPPPTIGERWQTGLEEILQRRDEALLNLNAELMEATGKERLALEKSVQARKLDFEIEVLELQMALDAERGAEAMDPRRTAARERVTAQIQAARNLRDGLDATRGADTVSDEAPNREGE